MPPQGSREETEKQDAARQAVDILHEISTILNCHLDRRTLSVCISMVENGVNPEALAVSYPLTLTPLQLHRWFLCFCVREDIGIQVANNLLYL
ncbi:mitotic-spindle organizing gamma-tubulin ring associated-domain-containing protein [Nemania abortiva]|nr:mitotic-spindle organizing gamma-tubulin ring associated-domain-containing protein [Nemania abortiva]